jgi:transcriptional regulator with XRE-family HTH domain
MNNIKTPIMAKIQHMDFYARVKQLAKKSKNLSLQEFIYSIGLNHASYYSLQRDGNLPRADEALAIAQALGTTVEYLLMGTEPENIKKTILDDFQAVIDRRRNPPKLPRKTRKN